MHNAHPHFSHGTGADAHAQAAGRVALVHNGIIENHEELRARLQARGYVFASQTDTEVIANLVDEMQATGDPKPDLIVSDVRMPKMDGFQMVERLKKDPKVSAIPVIFLTAKGTSKDVIMGIKSGARHYLTKPFDMNELLDKVRRAMPVGGH